MRHAGVEVFPLFKDREPRSSCSWRATSPRRGGRADRRRDCAHDRSIKPASRGSWRSSPVVINTGGGSIVRASCARLHDGVLAGNALAVHDIERALYGHLWVSTRHRKSRRRGHKNHMRAINAIRRCGSIAHAVREGS